MVGDSIPPTPNGRQGKNLETRKVLWDRIPKELRDRSQWCVARPDGKPRQVDGNFAKANDPTTWTTYEKAKAAAIEKGWHIGYVLTADDPYTCIDMDDHGAVLEPNHFALDIEFFDSYAERSKSGKGFHVWVKGKRPDGWKNTPLYQIFTGAQFIVCTGDVVRNKPIEERQNKLEAFVGKYSESDQRRSEKNYAFAKDYFRPLIRRLIQTPAFINAAERGHNLEDYSSRTAEKSIDELLAEFAEVERGKQLAEGLGKVEEMEFDIASDTAEEEPPEWLVDNLIPETGIGAIYGQSGTYKSFLALDLLATLHNAREGAVRVKFHGLDLTLESKWFGRKIKQCSCFYIPLEGRGGIGKRIKAWQEANGCDAPFYVMRKPIDLLVKKNLDALVRRMNRVKGRKVLLIDTLAQMGGDYNENSSEGMGKMIAIIQELQLRIPDSVIIVVHHSGKVAERGLRGHTSLLGALDFSLECKIEDKGPLFRIAKNKDGEDGVEIPFCTIKQELQYDSGRKDSSLILLPREVAEGSESVSEEEIVFSHIGAHGPISQRKLIAALMGQVAKSKIEQFVKALIGAERIKTTKKGLEVVGQT